MQEKEVFEQEIDKEELENVTGGDKDTFVCSVNQNFNVDGSSSNTNCVKDHERNIYEGSGFPNCAATVEDSSWCGTNDACHSDAVVYKGMNDCGKAWR